MKSKIYILAILVLSSCELLGVAHAEVDPEPDLKECDSVYTEEVYVVCCGMTGPGGLPPGSDCQTYNYCVEKVICKKP